MMLRGKQPSRGAVTYGAKVKASSIISFDLLIVNSLHLRHIKLMQVDGNDYSFKLDSRLQCCITEVATTYNSSNAKYAISQMLQAGSLSGRQNVENIKLRNY
ncbi:hypothetical protein GUJ93_ZPchr0002g25840 [Zizania palustris]|uniref:Uncharacterized protein n=1 Tax=Zizania palustris TaxID=103762 RepID=A0A8J5S2G5_ZIZPA|nr:hypothetical protein GUJ93_ZPchr0002g25840 [Zizania palustris]